jgi:predicted homoserine dehydrogenase-like protein
LTTPFIERRLSPVERSDLSTLVFQLIRRKVSVVRYGIVGIGAMGREHAENLRNIPGARVVAVSDPDENSIAQARSAIGEDLLCFQQSSRTT